MFGFFKVLLKLDFVPPVSDGTLPLYIRVFTGEAFYYDPETKLYINKYVDPPRCLPQGVVEDIIAEPEDYLGEYELSLERVTSNGTILPAPVPNPEPALA